MRLITVVDVSTGQTEQRDMTAAEIAALPPPPPLDVAGIVEAHVQSVARGMGYSSGASCAGYVTSTVPQWAAEAAAFVAWRDAVWLAVFARRNEAPPATAADVLALLPAWVPPG